MARKHSKSGKKRTHKVRRHRGGGWGFTGPSSIPGTPGTVNNAQVFTGIGDCRAVQPGYSIPYSQYGASLKGLPGMSGGKRTRKGSKGKTRRQRGGRYGFYPEGDVNTSGQAWWAGSYAPVQRIACEGTTQNPLNPTHTGSSAPPGAASPNYYMAAGKGLMSGGAQQLAPATYGVGNVDSMYHYSPTAGYANTASTWKDSVGAPVQIQVPYAARAMNQACLTTGGHPPLTGALQAGGKRNRKGKGTRRVRRGGAFELPFGLSIPTSRENFAGIGQRLRNRIPALGGIGSFFGFGGPAANATPVAPAEPPATPLPPAEPPALTNGNGNGNGNGNRNNNRNNGMIAPPPAPEPEPEPEPAPTLQTGTEGEGMNGMNGMNGINGMNGLALPPPPSTMNASASTEGNPFNSSTSLSFGGRSRSKSRRSRRSALKKKKF